MLSDEERRVIVEAARGLPEARGACVEALAIVQRGRGWVADEIAEIATLLGMAVDELDAVATAYSLVFRRPVGRHVIQICDCVACWILGHETVLEHLVRRLGAGLGETTADGEFTLLPAACLGACDRAPAMLVDAELHGELTPERIDAILARYRA
ncbi:MAG TPA: NADH-quinone oxidoreductase subunit NuoE [bacterium]